MSFRGPAGRQPQNLSPAAVASSLRSITARTPTRVVDELVANAITHVGRRLVGAAESGSRRKIDRAIESYGAVADAVADLAGRDVVVHQVLELARYLVELTDQAEQLGQLRHEARAEPPCDGPSWSHRYRRRAALTVLELRTALERAAALLADGSTAVAFQPASGRFLVTESPPGQLVATSPHVTTGPPLQHVAPLSVDELAAAA